MRSRFIIILLICIPALCKPQFIKNFGQYDTTYNPGKMRLIGVSTGTVYTGAIIALNNLWYDTKGSFHWFDDSKQWKQMDKIGHAVTAYHESKAIYELMQWSGVKSKGLLIAAGMSGFIFQLPIEIMDGYSPTYGASASDIAYNFLGSALLTGQELAWQDTYIHPKFSFHTTPIAKERPNFFGTSWNQNILKDYNGQTYWLQFNLFPLINNDKFPKWLSISAGYGAEEMLYGSPEENQANGRTAYRQWYLAPDIDFSRIETNKKGLKVLFFFMNIFHPPLPTLEINKNGINGRILYF